jgi:hypothetical protein
METALFPLGREARYLGKRWQAPPKSPPHWGFWIKPALPPHTSLYGSEAWLQADGGRSDSRGLEARTVRKSDGLDYWQSAM